MEPEFINVSPELQAAYTGKPVAQQVPSIGRVVHYILPDGHNKGQHRPAIIVRTWGDPATSTVQLQIFLDGANDVPPTEPFQRCGSSVKHDPTGTEFGTWHWPEYVPAK